MRPRLKGGSVPGGIRACFGPRSILPFLPFQRNKETIMRKAINEPISAPPLITLNVIIGAERGLAGFSGSPPGKPALTVTGLIDLFGLPKNVASAALDFSLRYSVKH